MDRELREDDFEVNIGKDIEIVAEESKDNEPLNLEDEGEKDIEIEQEEEEGEALHEKEKIESKKSKESIPQDKVYRDKIAKERRLRKESERKASDAISRVQKLEEDYYKAVQYSYQADMAAVNGEEGNISASLQVAEKDYEDAIIEGDVKKQVDSNKRIATLTARQQDLIRYKFQQQNNKPVQQSQEQTYQQQQQHIPYNPDMDSNEDRADWVRRNTWANERSPNFNPDMAEEISYVAARLNSEFKRTGKSDLICGEEYFNELDKYVEDKFNNVKKEPVQRNKYAPSRIAPVKHSSNSRIPLSKDQKDMIAAAGITEDDFRKQWAPTSNEIGRK